MASATSPFCSYQTAASDKYGGSGLANSFQAAAVARCGPLAVWKTPPQSVSTLPSSAVVVTRQE